MGYYTVGTWETTTQEEALELVPNPIPSKVAAHFQHIERAPHPPMRFTPVLELSDVTRHPVYFTELFEDSDSEAEKGTADDDDDDVEYPSCEEEYVDEDLVGSI